MGLDFICHVACTCEVKQMIVLSYCIVTPGVCMPTCTHPKLTDDVESSNSPQTEGIHCIVKASFNHPFWLRPTTTAGTWVSLGMVHTLLKTTVGFSFLPSVIAATMTIKLPLSWPTVRTEMDHFPTLDILVSPGISSHKGVSSILPVQNKGYWWRSHIYLTCRMKVETFVIMPSGSHW